MMLEEEGLKTQKDGFQAGTNEGGQSDGSEVGEGREEA